MKAGQTAPRTAERGAIPPQRIVNGVSINRDLLQGPWFVDGCDTLVSLFRHRCRELGDRVAHREKELGVWQSHSWAEFYEKARLIGLGLKRLGLERGEVVSILSEDRKEWIWADLGIQSVGGIASGIYTTDASAQVAYLVNDSRSRFLIVENEEQLDKFLERRDEMPGLEKVIVIDPEGLHDFRDDQVMFLDDLYVLGDLEHQEHPEAFEAAIDAVRPEDVAILVYTSGTTGPPKGAMITHENIMFSISAGIEALPVFPDDEQICFLPLCHILERLISVFTPIAARSTVNFAESPETVFDNMREVSPTVFTAVPRVWEKIHSRVTLMADDATRLGQQVWNRALKVGLRRAEALYAGRPVPLLVELEWRLWDLVALRNVRRMLGMDRLRRGTSGAAPIAPELLKWYRAIGVLILEGYGMTESAGLISVNTIERNRLGSVGPVIPGAKARIGEGGEVQYKGGNCFLGYWRKPDKTAETYTSDGWLRTGDVGRIDEDGFLYITGRLKDIIITAGGKNITPAEIENRIKFSPYVSDAVVIGDRRKYLTCLVMIDRENVEKFAQDNRIPFSDFASLTRAPEVRRLIAEVIEEVNRDFARVEQIKDFRLIDVLLDAEDEELTATMKLKRAVIERKYKDLIDEMYR